MLYPLKFEPVYKHTIWGGRNIEKKFKRQIPEGKVAESWEVCCRRNGMSKVANGPLKGKTLDELIVTFGTNLLGASVYDSSYDTFPLLIKMIDANDKLSVQVHPDDEYAVRNNEKNGKNEMWYVIDAKPGAKLIYGLKSGVSKEQFLESIKNESIENILNEVPVKAGDSLYIPSGTVHAILEGLMIAEIQQNSDTTYRVYDWNRVDANGNHRELHIKKALDVVNFNEESSPTISTPATFEKDGQHVRELSNNKYFVVEELTLDRNYSHKTDGSKFLIYMVIDGSGTIEFDGHRDTLKPGETLFIPASLGHYKLTGNMKVLRIHL